MFCICDIVNRQGGRSGNEIMRVFSEKQETRGRTHSDGLGLCFSLHDELQAAGSEDRLFNCFK